ncbi:MAG: 3-hydroxyacyl-CoA dehydrogenase NAD-binding domain-containing protein [Inquilinaceae bacterium]
MADPTTAFPDPAPPRVAVIGAGAIGVGVAAVFADRGFAVDIVEPDGVRRDAIRSDVLRRHPAMDRAGLAESDADGAAGRIVPRAGLGETRPDPAMIVEAGPEALALKRAIFSDLLDWAGPSTVIATTSSALTISQIVDDPSRRTRCLCAHVINPPTVIRLVECAPSPQTAPDATDRAIAVFRAGGFVPVRLGREIPGFVFNRLQGAILREAYRLVSERVIDVADLDLLVTEGLGPRWALSGPFETAELNTPGGIQGHAARMGPAYRAIGEDRGERECVWPPDLVADVDRQRRAILPLDDLPARRAWREDALSRLLAVRRPILDRWARRSEGAGGS